jgi:hypothetical protein
MNCGYVRMPDLGCLTEPWVQVGEWTRVNGGLLTARLSPQDQESDLEPSRLLGAVERPLASGAEFLQDPKVILEGPAGQGGRIPRTGVQPGLGAGGRADCCAQSSPSGILQSGQEPESPGPWDARTQNRPFVQGDFLRYADPHGTRGHFPLVSFTSAGSGRAAQER